MTLSLNNNKQASFLRFEMPFIYSNMYLYIKGEQALIVDPNTDEDANKLLVASGVNNATILLTHEHFDHVSGVNFLRQSLDCKVICQENCAISMASAKNNRPLIFLPLMKAASNSEAEKIRTFYESFSPKAVEADITFQKNYDFNWQGHKIHIESCPGHSMGSSVITFDDIYVFTGDYMIPGSPVILRFPEGSENDYLQKTLPYLSSIKENAQILPGHGNPYLNKNNRKRA